MSQQYADIIVDISSEKLDRTFQYRVPEHLKGRITEGMVVRVPFGRGDREISGYVIGLSDEPKFDEDKIKEIIRLENSQETVESRLIALAAWMRENYGSTMIQALKTVLPVKKQIAKKEERRFRLNMEKAQGEAYLKQCLNRHYVAKARAVAAVLDQEWVPYEVMTGTHKVTSSVLKGLVEDGVLTMNAREVYRAALEKADETEKVLLTETQRVIAEDICDEWEYRDRPCLIHGITGSGKTSIYMDLIARVVEKGQQVIVLIPEIALTRQTVARFMRRFGSGISFLNSRMTPAERYDQFKAAKRGDVQIMVGPRSALFTPFSNLGLIILDEEHENTYISETAPRYHAREVAIKRAQLEHGHVIMGSATPSVDACYAAKQGRYRLFSLKERYGTSRLPDVSVVDMREELKTGNRSILSTKLQKAMEDRLSRGEQMMLFLNRRGYAGFVSCRSCGHVVKCPHCDVALSSHNNGKMLCHYCGYEMPQVRECPECHSPYISGFKIGTQQIEDVVKKRFPQARVIRMDLDSTKGKEGHAKILQTFENREADILIGTQMIVKGHDFPYVTLVGVLAADLSLNSSDYRASERTFQLITQAVGRAGRGERAGEAIVQTYHPDHYSIVAAVNQDYESFYEEEIAYRILLDYPPSGCMMAVLGSGQDEEHLETAMEYLKKFILKIYPKADLQVIGPALPGVGKVRDVYRRVIYCKHAKYNTLVAIKNQLERYIEINSGFDTIQIQFDFNK